MAEAIENVIDTWLIEQFTAEMGSGSSYANNKLSQVETAILRSPKDWETWTFPALGISNRFVTRSAQMHPFALDKAITYLLTFVTYGTESAAIQASRTLLTRAEIALATIKGSVNSITNDYGEQCQQMIFYASREFGEAGSSRMRKYIDPTKAGKWFIAQDISVVITTTTGV